MATAKPDYRELDAYKLADSIGISILALVNGLDWPPQWQWLQTRLLSEAQDLTSTLAAGYKSDLIAEWALGVGDCRNAVMMAEYILSFLRGQQMIAPSAVDPVLEDLEILMNALVNSASELRDQLLEHPRAQLV